MTELVTTHPVDRFEVGAVLTDYVGDAVVLDHSNGRIELCRSDGTISTQAASTSLVRQYDPGRQERALRQAVTALDTERRRLTTEHATTLGEIRAAAIAKHEDGGEICHDGLNAFLREFGMAEYGPRIRVSFTVRGSYEVDTTDEYEARTGAENQLGLDLSDISEADEDSLSYKVEATELQAIGS